MTFLERASEYFQKKAVPWVDGIKKCVNPEFLIAYLLGGILLQLKALTEAATFGSHYFKINAFTLTTVPARIIEKDPQGLVRKISFWVDSAAGGPTPTIRISQGASSSNGGGIRINAGQVNEIGEIPHGTELWASASTSIVCYVIERA